MKYGIVLLLSLLTGCREITDTNKGALRSPHCKTPGVVKAPFVAATYQFCDRFDIASFLLPEEDDSTGINGVLDTTLWRLQVHFISVSRNNQNKTIYDVEGATRSKKRVKHFTGFIKFDTVRISDRNYWFAQDTCADINELKTIHDSLYQRWEIFRSHQFDEKHIELRATYFFFEDSSNRNNGFFTGKLSFSLAIDSTGTLSDNLPYYEGIYAENFFYEGFYKQYNSLKKTWVYWQDYGRNDYLMGCIMGDGCDNYLPCMNEPGMIEKGWETDDDCNMIDDPGFWWKTAN